MQKPKLGAILILLAISELGRSQNVPQDPVLFTAGSINVYQSAIKNIDISINDSVPTQVARPLRSLENLSQDDSFAEVMRQGEEIARAFEDSKVIGLYRIHLLVPPQEFAVWNRYQKDLARIFEQRLQSQALEQASRLEIFIGKLVGGNGVSEEEPVAAVDPQTGVIPKGKFAQVNLRLRREYGQVMVVANLLDRSFAPQSRSTLSIMDGPEMSLLRLRQSIRLPYIGGHKQISEPQVNCDINRIHHSSRLFKEAHPGLRYETRFGCEVRIQFY